MTSRSGPKPPASQPTADELLHFFNQSPDLLCIAGLDGIFKHLNPAWSPLLGWTNEELLSRPFLDFVHPDDRPATLAVMDHFDTGAATLSFENRYHCKDGSWKWLRWTASPLLDQQEIYAIARDVTHQKRLDLQILAASEHKQQRIARDLHDSLGPHLAGIRYAAKFLADELRQHDTPAAAKADQIGTMAGEAVTFARNLARGIFPVQLDGLGLAQALEELAATTSRHAAIVLIHSEHAVCLTVTDDGHGLPPSTHGTRGMGLDSMRYRARALGGELIFDSLPDASTIVTCEIPDHSPATRAS